MTDLVCQYRLHPVGVTLGKLIQFNKPLFSNLQNEDLSCNNFTVLLKQFCEMMLIQCLVQLKAQSTE